jgi:hypothetical protein
MEMQKMDSLFAFRGGAYTADENQGPSLAKRGEAEAAMLRLAQDDASPTFRGVKAAERTRASAPTRIQTGLRRGVPRLYVKTAGSVKLIEK